LYDLASSSLSSIGERVGNIEAVLHEVIDHINANTEANLITEVKLLMKPPIDRIEMLEKTQQSLTEVVKGILNIGSNAHLQLTKSYSESTVLTLQHKYSQQIQFRTRTGVDKDFKTTFKTSEWIDVDNIGTTSIYGIGGTINLKPFVEELYNLSGMTPTYWAAYQLIKFREHHTIDLTDVNDGLVSQLDMTPIYYGADSFPSDGTDIIIKPVSLLGIAIAIGELAYEVYSIASGRPDISLGSGELDKIVEYAIESVKQRADTQDVAALSYREVFQQNGIYSIVMNGHNKIFDESNMVEVDGFTSKPTGWKNTIIVPIVSSRVRWKVTAKTGTHPIGDPRASTYTLTEDAVYEAALPDDASITSVWMDGNLRGVSLGGMGNTEVGAFGSPFTPGDDANLDNDLKIATVSAGTYTSTGNTPQGWTISLS
jgi:hypothetical protein